MDAFIEACRQGVAAVPRPVHWGVMCCYFIVGAGFLCRVEGLVKEYHEDGGLDERARVVRWIVGLFALGLIGMPYALLLDQQVYPQGIPGFGRRGGPIAAVILPSLDLIAALFYGVKVLRHAPG